MSNGNLPKFEEILTYYFGNDNPDIPWYDKLTIDNKRRVIKRLYVIYDAIRLINNYINECETPVRNITAMSGNRHLIQLLKHEKNEIRKNIIDIIIDDLKQNITLTECTELGSYITPDTPSFLFEAEYISNEEFRDEFESKYIINGICKIPHLRSSYNRLNAQQTQSLEW
jgi:hypothetical protein